MTKKKHKEPVTVGFIALGCAKNIVDSERMLAEIAEAGLLITADPQEAQVVVINTCGFIAPAKDESLAVIKEAVGYKANGGVKKVIVAGCLAERLREKLFEEAGGIDAVVGLGQRDKIAQIIKKTVQSSRPAVYLDQSCEEISDDRARLLITPHHLAYLRISEGCDRKCSFCTIPSIRGRFRSKPQELILSEAAELVRAGVVELNIIAQDTSYYGRDLKIKNGLAGLLRELEKTDGLNWIRLLYLYPAGITDELIETIAKSEKIVHYFDIPLQHINNRILKDMRRPESKEQIISLIEKLRKALPDSILRTTLIAGFPGETDAEFGELVEFVRWAKFDALGCFKLYPETGTAAAVMPNQVPEEIKQARFDELMSVQQQIAFAKNKNRIDTRLVCLVDWVDDKGTGHGRFYGQAPDIDSICFIQNCKSNAGEFIDTKVIGTRDYDLAVEQI